MLRKFNPRAEKLVKKSEISFVDFTTNTVTIKGVGKKDFDPVTYKGQMRLAISK